MKKTKKLILRYIAHPMPMFMFFEFEKRKTGFEMINNKKLVLEPFQVDGFYLIDEIVLGQQIKELLGLQEKSYEQGIVFLYDIPTTLRFNTILPKSNFRRASALLKKELNNFISGIDQYKSNKKIVFHREHGVMCYVDLIPNQLIMGFERLANSIDFYIDTSLNYLECVVQALQNKPDVELNHFVVYQDETIAAVILVFEGKLIDAFTIYNKEDNYYKQLDGIIEIIRGKHSFAFEKKASNNLTIISENKIIKNGLIEYFKTKYEVIDSQLDDQSIMSFIAKNSGEIDESYQIKI